MGNEIVYCSRCQSRLTTADFDRGTAVRISNYVCCFACLSEAEQATLKQSQNTSASRLSTLTPRSVPAASGSPRSEPAAGPPVILWASVGGVAVLAIAVVLVLSLRDSGKPSPPAAPAATN